MTSCTDIPFPGHGLALLPTKVHAFDLDDLAAAGARASAVALSRRRTFGSCRYCRDVTAPETRIERDACDACASRWQGAVY